MLNVKLINYEDSKRCDSLFGCCPDNKHRYACLISVILFMFILCCAIKLLQYEALCRHIYTRCGCICEMNYQPFFPMDFSLFYWSAFDWCLRRWLLEVRMWTIPLLFVLNRWAIKPPTLVTWIVRSPSPYRQQFCARSRPQITHVDRTLRRATISAQKIEGLLTVLLKHLAGFSLRFFRSVMHVQWRDRICT